MSTVDVNTTSVLQQITQLAERNGTRSNYYHAQALALLRRLWEAGYVAGQESGKGQS